jgi:hypothetical protein
MRHVRIITVLMSEENEREEIKDETHQVQDEEQEELDEVEDKEEVEREDTFSNKDRSKK